MNKQESRKPTTTILVSDEDYATLKLLADKAADERLRRVLRYVLNSEKS